MTCPILMPVYLCSCQLGLPGPLVMTSLHGHHMAAGSCTKVVVEEGRLAWCQLLSMAWRTYVALFFLDFFGLSSI